MRTIRHQRQRTHRRLTPRHARARPTPQHPPPPPRATPDTCPRRAHTHLTTDIASLPAHAAPRVAARRAARATHPTSTPRVHAPITPVRARLRSQHRAAQSAGSEGSFRVPVKRNPMPVRRPLRHHRQRRRRLSTSQRRARCPRTRAASSARRGTAHAAPGPASPPLAGLRLPAFIDEPASPARSLAPAPNQAFTATPGTISHPATSRPARKSPPSSKRRTPATSRPRAALPQAECAQLVADGGTFDVGYPPTSTSLRPDAPQTRRAPRRALRAGASGSFPSPLLIGPLPASDEGQGLKAAPEAE